MNICPICGKKYDEEPALSRRDNQTPICPECGMREALEIFGLSAAQTDYIIDLERRARDEKNYTG